MPVHSPGDQRWTHTGNAPSGDKIYERSSVSTAGRDYTELTKEELQNLLKHMGLPISGNKDELIERLQDGE
jgi:hypothetical protein